MKTTALMKIVFAIIARTEKRKSLRCSDDGIKLKKCKMISSRIGDFSSKLGKQGRKECEILTHMST